MTREPQRPEEAGISDEEISALVLRAQQGEAEAFADLLRAFQTKLHRQALFLTRDEHQAHDLLQETMIETWRHIQRYDGRARFFGWICSIMVHRHYDWLRRLRARAFAMLKPLPDANAGSELAPPGEALAKDDAGRLMRECLDELPLKQRTTLYLRFYADESLEGIAALMQCSLGTVKSRLFHGMSRLANMRKIKDLRNEL